ncbi:MAG: hypothetical protein LCH46_06560 [Proteobacteria bacterium]|nr:hypothetical protein [Pseudomonadota bacterium]
MSKLISILGIILLAVGLVLAVWGLVSPEHLPAALQLQGFLQSAVMLFVGGVLAFGIGGVIAALEKGRPASVAIDDFEPIEEVPLRRTPVVSEAEPAPAVITPEPEPDLEPEIAAEPAVIVPPAPPKEEAPLSSRLRFPGFGRKPDSPAASAAAAAAGGATLSPSVQQTIEALEQARVDLNKAIGGVAVPPPPVLEPVAPIVEPPAPPAEEPAVEAEAAPSDGSDLYVVEDKVIRGRPARILSDGTVEAETDEGWMRFENIEHLNEYLDATQPE